MALIRFLVLVAFVQINLYEIKGHGCLMDPVNRGSAFRKGFPTPENWDDDGNYCGGYVVQFKQNNGKCGVCGDNYIDTQPRSNENGGKYGTGLIVKTYKAGSQFVANVNLTASHLGYYTFNLCPLKDKNDLETEDCFDAYKLELSSGGYEYPVKTSRTGDYLVELRLPKDLTCEQCVLRWQYTAGNNWGKCDNGTSRQGCGDQETFRTCSDIKIE